MLQRHILLGAAGTFSLAQHEISAKCHTEFNLWNFMGHVEATELCMRRHDHVPAAKLIFEPIRDKIHLALQYCIRKKIATVHRGVHGHSSNWNDSDRSRLFDDAAR